MTNEIVYTVPDELLNEQYTSDFFQRLGSRTGGAKVAAPQFSTMQANTGSLDIGYNAPKNERNVTDSYYLYLQSVQNQLKDFKLSNLSNQQNKEIAQKILNTFYNTQTLSPQMFVVLKEASVKVTPRTTITINLTEIINEYNLNDQQAEQLKNKVLSIGKNLQSLKSNIKIQFIEQNKLKPNQPKQPKDKEKAKKIAKQYSKQLNVDEETLVNDILTVAGYIGSLAGIASGGIGTIIGMVPDLLNAVIYFKRGNNKKGLISLLGAIPLAGDIAFSVKFLKSGKRLLDFLKFIDLLSKKEAVKNSLKSIIIRVLAFFKDKNYISTNVFDYLNKFIEFVFGNNKLQTIKNKVGQILKENKFDSLLLDPQFQRWQKLANI